MKYEYGVEYPCNGEKPDLPDDVLVQVWSWGSSKWHDPSFVGDRRWSTWNKFRIVDERYKNEHHIPDIGKKIESDWLERGDKCEVLLFGDDEWKSAKFFGYDPDDNSLIFKHLKGYSQVKSWRAPRTDRDELIDLAKEALPDGEFTVGEWSLSVKIIEALADSGMLNKPEEENG